MVGKALGIGPRGWGHAVQIDASGVHEKVNTPVVTGKPRPVPRQERRGSHAELLLECMPRLLG